MRTFKTKERYIPLIVFCGRLVEKYGDKLSQGIVHMWEETSNVHDTVTPGLISTLPATWLPLL